MVVWAIPAEEVQAFAPTAHAHQETLAEQQPTALHPVQPPNRMTRIDVVAPGPWGVRAFRLALVPRDPLDEGLLLVGVCFPQEAAHLVVTDAHAFAQIVDARGRLPDAPGGF